MVTLCEMIDVQRDRVLDLLSEGKESFGVVGEVRIYLAEPILPMTPLGTVTTAVMVVPMDGGVYVLTFERGRPAHPARTVFSSSASAPWPADALTALVTTGVGFFHVDTAASKDVVMMLQAALEVSSGTMCPYVMNPNDLLDPNIQYSSRPPMEIPSPPDPWSYQGCPRCGQVNPRAMRGTRTVTHGIARCVYCRALLDDPPFTAAQWTTPTARCHRCNAPGYDITTGGCGVCGAPF